MHVFTFDGISSTAFEAYVWDEDVYSSPSRDYTTSAIPGRNGDAYQSNHRLTNVQHSYHIIIKDNFEANYQAMRGFLLSRVGYCRLEDSVHPVCYNGDIFTQEDYEALVRRFPSLDRVMIGRGLVANPGLVRQIKTGQKITREELRRYAGELFEGYCEAYGEEKNALYKMKEIWYYLGSQFPDSEKILKKIKKAATGAKYQEAVEELFLR